MQMRGGLDKRRQIYTLLFAFLLLIGYGFYAAVAHQCNHGHNHHQHQSFPEDVGVAGRNRVLLPEEMAEEEDLKMMWSNTDHDIEYRSMDVGAMELSGLGLWIHAMACSLLVSLASLICLILLPLIFIQGKPSKTVVDCLALFGAGAMLGDAFLHQLPHAFGRENSHSHDHHDDHAYDYDHVHVHFGSLHSHSLKDLSVGLSILGGIVVFLIVEKLVRYVEEFSGGQDAWSHGHHHHHHHHKHGNNVKNEDGAHEDNQESSQDDEKKGGSSRKTSDVKKLDRASTKNVSDKSSERDPLRKRQTAKNGSNLSTENISNPIHNKEPTELHSNLVFGYLNLFSDGVHNFTDGMALGSAFLLYGSVGGWSRTLFLLAHELPQEIGDFGILVRSGFSVSKALFFNFLSALVALAGTALALMWGKDPGQSTLIEGFTAGGFIYIALGVLGEMNNGSSSALRLTITQLIWLLMGMSIALCISLVE